MTASFFSVDDCHRIGRPPLSRAVVLSFGYDPDSLLMFFLNGLSHLSTLGYILFCTRKRDGLEHRSTYWATVFWELTHVDVVAILNVAKWRGSAIRCLIRVLPWLVPTVSQSKPELVGFHFTGKTEPWLKKDASSQNLPTSRRNLCMVRDFLRDLQTHESVL